MRKDIENKLINKKEDLLKEMPDFVVDFIFNIENKYSLKTQIAYLTDIRIFFNFLNIINGYPDRKYIDTTLSEVDALSDRDLREFLSYLTEYTISFKKRNGQTTAQTFSNTIQGKARKFATLRTLFSYLYKRKLIKEDVTKLIDIKVPTKDKLNNTLETSQINKFFQTILDDVNIENSRQLKFHKRLKFRDYVIVAILAHTGVRISELTQLDISDINVDNGAMVVIRKAGNQDKIYLPEKILEPITEYLLKRKKIKDIDPIYKNALFISQFGKRIDTKTVRYMLNKYKKRSGIDIDITPHTFRRTFGNKFYNDTKDMYLTAQQLGHCSAETTRKYYAKPAEERKKQSMKNFNYGSEDNTALAKKEIELNVDKIDKLLELTNMTYDELITHLK